MVPCTWTGVINDHQARQSKQSLSASKSNTHMKQYKNFHIFLSALWKGVPPHPTSLVGDKGQGGPCPAHKVPSLSTWPKPFPHGSVGSASAIAVGPGSAD